RAQDGTKVTRAQEIAVGNPPTFQPMKLIIRIMLGPGRACTIAKQSANSRSVSQARAVTTKSCKSGNTPGTPPKLMIANNAMCPISGAEQFDEQLIARPHVPARRWQSRLAPGLPQLSTAAVAQPPNRRKQSPLRSRRAGGGGAAKDGSL